MFSSVLTLSLFFGASNDSPSGYVTREIKGKDNTVRKETIPYVPREGDLIFYDDKSIFWTILFAWAGTGPPLHMGIVVKGEDGKFQVLEAGPDDKLKVYLLELNSRLKDFKGTITIRRCKVKLTEEKSAALTKFAKEQDGKPYAVIRLLLQGTSLRSRGPVREMFLAGTYLDRWSWICSELAVAAGTVVGLFDPAVVRANVTYPRDIVDNQRFNLSKNWHDGETWGAQK
jgi:hypothetical protein